MATKGGTNARELSPLPTQPLFRLKGVSKHLGGSDIGEELVDGLA